MKKSPIIVGVLLLAGTAFAMTVPSPGAQLDLHGNVTPEAVATEGPAATPVPAPDESPRPLTSPGTTGIPTATHQPTPLSNPQSVISYAPATPASVATPAATPTPAVTSVVSCTKDMPTNTMTCNEKFSDGAVQVCTYYVLTPANRQCSWAVTHPVVIPN